MFRRALLLLFPLALFAQNQYTPLSGLHADIGKYPPFTWPSYFFYETDTNVLKWSNSVTWSPIGSVILADTRANRIANYPPANYPVNTIFIETDSTLIYYVQVVSAANAWVYLSGTYQRTQSQISTLAASLGTNDTGLLANVTDYAHVLQWSGSAFGWGPGESGSGFFSDFAVAPTGNGWHACDGSSGVRYLTATGGTGTVTLPNAASTSAYRKGASAYSATITAATTPTFTGTPATPAGTNSAPVFTGTPAAITTNVFTPVALATTALTSLGGSTATYTPAGTVSAPAFTGTPATPAGTITLPGDPIPNYQAVTFFRQ